MYFINLYIVLFLYVICTIFFFFGNFSVTTSDFSFILRFHCKNVYLYQFKSNKSLLVFLIVVRQAKPTLRQVCDTHLPTFNCVTQGYPFVNVFASDPIGILENPVLFDI